MRDENPARKHDLYEALTELFQGPAPEPAFVYSLESKLLLRHAEIRGRVPINEIKSHGLWNRTLIAPIRNGWRRVISGEFKSNPRRMGIVLVAGLVMLIAIGAITYRILAPGYENKVGDIWIYESAEAQSVPLIAPDEILLPASQPTPIPLDEAAEMLRFEFSPPTWLPEGFTLASQHLYVPGPPGCCINALWTDTQGQIILLLANKNLEDDFRGEVRVLPGSWRKVSVGQLPAVLIRGGVRVISPDAFPPDAPLAWDEESGYQLAWVKDGVFYRLITFAPSLSDQDLVRLAASID